MVGLGDTVYVFSCTPTCCRVWTFLPQANRRAVVARPLLVGDYPLVIYHSYGQFQCLKDIQIVIKGIDCINGSCSIAMLNYQRVVAGGLLLLFIHIVHGPNPWTRNPKPNERGGVDHCSHGHQAWGKQCVKWSINWLVIHIESYQHGKWPELNTEQYVGCSDLTSRKVILTCINRQT